MADRWGEIKHKYRKVAIKSGNRRIDADASTSDIPDEAWVREFDLGEGWTAISVSWGGGDGIMDVGPALTLYHHPRITSLDYIPCRVVERVDGYLPRVEMVPDHPLVWGTKHPIPQNVLDAEAQRRQKLLGPINVVP